MSLLLVGCTSTAWRDVETDHETAAAAPPELSGVGPGPGVLREEWRISGIETGGGSEALVSPTFHLLGGTLVVVTGLGVDAFNADTGEELWHYREPGRTLSVGATADTVVVESRSPDEDEEDGGRLAGLDAGTGELLWEARNEWRVGGGGGPPLTVAEGILPVIEADQHDSTEISGIDVRTGEIAWTTEYDDCGIADLDPPRTSDGSLVLLIDSCAGDRRWQAFASDTGELLWTEDVSASANDATVREGTTIIEVAEQVLVVGRDGTIDSLENPDSLPRSSIGFHLPIREDSGESTLIDVRTGEETSHSWPGLTLGAVPAIDEDGTLYALDDTSSAPVPALVIGDPGGGDPTVMPMPGSYLVDGQPLWSGTVGERLLVARRVPPDGPMQVFAYASDPTDGPVELGGVLFEDWPDPCDVPDVAGATGDTELDSQSPITVGSEEIPSEECRIFIEDPEYTDPDSLTVRISWVAAEPELAESWLGGEPGPPGVDEVVDGGHYLTARIGRVVVAVSSYDSTDIDPEEVLEALAERLADY